jgi:hypothetical protein
VRRRALAALMLCVACGAPASTTDAGSDAGGAVRRVTITNAVFNDPGPGLRLSDGVVLPAGSGDLWLQQRSVISLYVAPPLGICDLGTSASLAATPTSLAACMGAPSDAMVLAASTDGTDQWVGRAWLVFAQTTDTVPIYRARIVADSNANPSITLTFEYEPL